MGVRNTFKYGYMICLYNKPNFTSKKGLKMHLNRFYRHVKFKYFLGGDPPTPLMRRGMTPLVLSPRSSLRPSLNAYCAQWPYHFSKNDDGPVMSILSPSFQVWWVAKFNLEFSKGENISLGWVIKLFTISRSEARNNVVTQPGP